MAYNPQDGSLSAKPYSPSQGVPTDGRSYYFDAVLYKWRPYQSTAEVLTYLDTPAKRSGQFPVFVCSGTLGTDGTFTGGTVTEYWFKDGINNEHLVAKTSGGGGGATSLALLDDVNVTSPSLNQILQYNGTDWVNGTAPATSLDGLSDVAITSPSTDQVLKYNGSSWVNGAEAAETDPTVPAHVKNISETDLSHFAAAYGWGNHAAAGYLTAETDPKRVTAVAVTGTTTKTVKVTLADGTEVTGTFSDESGGSSGKSKSLSVEYPTASENITLFFTDTEITVSNAHTILRATGFTYSVAFNVCFAADRASGSPSTLFTSDQSLNGTTTVVSFTPNTATIPANSWVWLTTSVASGTVSEFHLTLNYQ
jgi:hypothetical protein